MKIFKIALIILSISLNILFGFFYFKGVVYQTGVNTGLNQAQMQFDILVESEQIIIPEQNEQE